MTFVETYKPNVWARDIKVGCLIIQTNDMTSSNPLLLQALPIGFILQGLLSLKLVPMIEENADAEVNADV